MKLSNKVLEITRLLEEGYNSPRHNNKKNPLNELLFILLSLRTDVKVYEDVYKDFKRVYSKWSDVVEDRVEEIAKVIYGAGLALQKAERLKLALDKIVADFGEPSLRKIKGFDDGEMFEYLLTLPGVGIKAAKCIMLYSFNRKVLPVDTHTYRVSKRLGLFRNNPSTREVHTLLEQLIKEALRYSYHVNCVAHGRATCIDKRPRCFSCILNKLCEYNS